MKFITKKDSETGKKFQKISEARKIAFNAQKAFAKKHGFKGFRPAYWVAFGGMSSCADFKETPNSSIWKKFLSGEYYPKKSTKEGKLIWQEIQDLPKVEIDDLNMCIGFNGAPFKTIGFAENNDEFFGFIVGEKWGAKIPSDCEEVTTTIFNNLFKIK